MTTTRARPVKGKPKGKGKAAAPPPPPHPAAPAIWRPGVDALDEGETLAYDPTAYDCMHALRLEWPCLSFDVVRDGLGENRATFPHALLLVAGTQAAPRAVNTLTWARLGRLGQGRHGARAAAADDSDASSSDDDDDDADPALHTRSVSLAAGVNRVRSAPHAPGLTAVWLESGSVVVHDGRAAVAELAAARDAAPARPRPSLPAPLAAAAHPTEGFGLDWSPAAPGRLASGDCGGGLRVWEPRDGGAAWAVSAPYGPPPAKAGAASVEDVQWSPTEGTVLATAAADGSLAVWDTRAPSRPQLTVPAAHAADANVISWSRRATYMLASGGDDGALAVWDLRALAGGAGGSSAAPSSSAAAARIAAHRAPVTSVEWSPAEPSVLVTSGEDAATCVWDLAVERDPDEEAALGVGAAAAPDALPPQLMFVHAGQADVKEAHWHPQIPGLLVTTAGDGFNVWKPSNI
jgi:ribosome assembly protein RRB1